MTDPKFIGPPQKLFKSYTMPKAKTATEIGKDIMKKTNVGAGKVLTALGSPIRTTKKILSKAKAKFTSAAARVKDISKGNISGAKGVQTPVNRPGVAKPKLNLKRAGKIPTGLGKQNPFVAQFKQKPKTARLASKALRVAKFARAATPIGLATVAVTSIKKFEPGKSPQEMARKAYIKGGRDPDKAMRDSGDVTKMLNYKGGGLKEATKKLKAQGYNTGKMITFAQFVKNRAGSQVSESKIQQLKNQYKRMMGGSQIGPSEEKKLNKMMKMSGGDMANLKKIPEGPKGEGLRKLKAARPDVTRKMGFAKKGKVMKAMAGKSVRGYGAARTSGMGLQDEQMVPGKSMDYYKDLM